MAEGSASLEGGARVSASRVGGLDGLRGCAAIAVMLDHYLWRGPGLYPGLGRPIAVASSGQHGVQLFFLISGFVIALSLRRSTPRSFITGRLIRLYPTYWFSMAVTLVVLSVFGLPGWSVNGRDVAANITMLAGLLRSHYIDGVYWTLGVEFVFYVACAGLWFTGLLTHRRLPWTLFGWLAATWLASMAIPVSRQALHEVTGNLPWFMVGMVALAIFRGDRRLSLLLFPATAGLVVASSDWRAAAFGTALFLVMLMVLLGQPVLLRSQPMRFLGDISYPLYLLHQSMGYVLLLALMGAGGPRWLALLLTIAAALAAATGVTFGFDKPVRKYLRGLLAPAPSQGVVTDR